MPFEKKIEKVFGTLLNQMEKMEKDIIKDSNNKDVSHNELGDLGFSDDEINFLVFKKRLLIKNKHELSSNSIHDLIYEIPADYYFKKLLSNEKIEQIRRLKELEKID